MPAWNYLKVAFWQRVPLPLLGSVPLNAVAIAGFSIAGLDHPLFWALGVGWETLWLTATAGRAVYRRKVDAAARRVIWRSVEERRLQLYNQLPPAERHRHHLLRTQCQSLILPRPDGNPDPAAELFLWLHLKLLLARIPAHAGQQPGRDPDVPRLHAGASVEITDPARSRLAEEAVSMLDPRQGSLYDPTAPLLPAIDATLLRIESELASAIRQTNVTSPCDFSKLARSAAHEVLLQPGALPQKPAGIEMDRLLDQLNSATTPEQQISG